MNKQLTENQENEKPDFKRTAIIAVNESTRQLDLPQLKALGFNDIETRIESLVFLAKTCATETGVLLAIAREKFDTTKQWVNWAKGVTGYEERRLFGFLSIGRMIISREPEFFEKVKGVEGIKLEVFAGVDRKTQDALLKDFGDDFWTLSRDVIVSQINDRIINPEKEQGPKAVEAAKAQSEFEKWIKLMRKFGKIDATIAAGIAVESSPEELITAACGILGTLEIATQSGKFEGHDLGAFVTELVNLTTALTPNKPALRG